MITALYYPDDITLMFTLYPILLSGYAGLFEFTPDPDAVWKSKNKIIVLFRFVKHRAAVGGREYVRRLKEKFERVVYFDDLADPREIADDLLDLVDAYYKKQLLVDRAGYERPAYGNRIFTDYYHEQYGVNDDDPVIARPLGKAEAAKLRLSWNLGLGSYPKSRIRKAVCLRLGARGFVRQLRPCLSDPASYRPGPKTVMKASARLRAGMERRTVSFQRELFIKATASRPDLFITGHIPLAEYNRELREVAGVLSPFGWGEICFRDFEAIINRAVLLKPSMDHVETWPDIYKAGQTYASLDWKADNVVETAADLLRDERRRTELSDNAYAAYLGGLHAMPDRVRRFIDEIAR
jgi:hypothetical protein